LAVLAVLLTACLSLSPAVALEAGRIGVLYVGCIARSPPFRDMKIDPLFSMSFVQATLRDWAGMSEEEVHRTVRIYMPRTIEELAGNYDAVVLANSNQMAVGPHIDKLARGVSEEGLGLLMSGGWETFGGTGSGLPWGQTSIGKLLPTEDVIGIWLQYGSLVIDEPDQELIRSLPWNLKNTVLADPVRWHHNPVTLKPGAKELAHSRWPGKPDDPLMVTWELDNDARIFALTFEIHCLSWFGTPWEYATDFGSNLMIYLARRPVPQDIGLVHSARSKIFEVETRRSLLMSLLEFCESFGANTQRLLLRFDDIDSLVAEALPEYLQLRFEEMLEAYGSVEEMVQELEEDALSLKNRTLMWVYVIEWLAVTGTGMAAAFLLWSVMIRRALYREVKVTRFKDQEW
jgi:hypothetical protein